MSKLIPIDGRVVLKGVEAEETTASGIIIPGAKEEKPKIYEVVAISEQGVPLKDGKFRPHVLKVGQKVFCGETYGGDVELDDEKFKIVSEESILSIIKD